MKKDRMKDALESIASRTIPQDTDLWPRIAAQLEKDTVSMKPLKLTWSLALAILALILVTSAAYALYRYFSDPGLQAAQEAGLITDLNSTAEPVVLPPATPVALESATLVGQEQSLEGVSLTLDWIYLEDGQQAFHLSTSGLAPDLRLGMPSVVYDGVTPGQYSGAILSMDDRTSTSGTYVSYQLVRKDGQFGGQVDMQVNIPLRRHQAGQITEIANFQFDLRDVPVIVPMGGGGGNSFAVRVNGIEMRQMHAIVTPDFTEARLCYQAPSADMEWRIGKVSVQFADLSGPVGEPVPAEGYRRVEDQAGQQCADVTFPLGKSAGDVVFYISAEGLVAQDNSVDRVDSTWQFGTVLIDNMYVPGVTSTPEAPLASETIGDLTATLDWAYADTHRMAFRVHFDGWQAGYFASNVTLRDRDGQDINSSVGSQPQDADPSKLFFEFEPVDGLSGERFDGQLVLAVSNDPVNFSSLAEFHFDLDLPLYPARVLDVMQRVDAGGVEMLLQRVSMTPSFTYAYLCFDKPTTGNFSDWQVPYQATSLKIGADETSMSTQRLMFDSDIGDLGKGPEIGWKAPITAGRCTKIGFPVGHHGRLETLVLTIPQLEQSIPEVVPDEAVKQAREQLKQEGIEIEYVTFTGNGGGGGGPVIKKKPEGMTDDEAYRRFIEALGYVYKGPWVFNVEIQP
jgi:hypothetical protein